MPIFLVLCGMCVKVFVLLKTQMDAGIIHQVWMLKDFIAFCKLQTSLCDILIIAVVLKYFWKKYFKYIFMKNFLTKARLELASVCLSFTHSLLWVIFWHSSVSNISMESFLTMAMLELASVCFSLSWVSSLSLVSDILTGDRIWACLLLQDDVLVGWLLWCQSYVHSCLLL